MLIFQGVVGGFNPFEKYQSNGIISPGPGGNKEYLQPHFYQVVRGQQSGHNIWNQHLLVAIDLVQEFR